MTGKRPKGVKTYPGPAGGWGALQAVAKTLAHQQVVAQGSITLLKANQPEGFDCPGCAWPDPKHTSSFEFCENGAKAITWESTAKRASPAFFKDNPVSELWEWNDHQLEDQGRLTHPMLYNASTDRYEAIGWDEAFSIIAEKLRALPDPDMAEFYTSGRASNEAAFLFQLFVRAFGTNNFPDCSNMCHEATSVGLPESIGIGKGTVTLEDFSHTDAIFSFGHNPGTNHPRMMTTLKNAAKRGVPIVVFNPLKERALERFEDPQNPVQMVTYSATPIASHYLQVRPGGDMAAIQGLIKGLLERDDADVASGGAGLLDRDFLDNHTLGFDNLKSHVRQLKWEDIVSVSGLMRNELEAVVDVYVEAKNVIICYGMGLTQHRNGTGNVQQIANLLLLRGNMGRPGAGIAPIRGHSNVQGDRTVGITEVPNDDLIDGIERAFGFRPKKDKGHNAVEALRAIADGRSKALICLGGNLAVAMPDHAATFPAFRKLDLVASLATKLNRSHLLMGETSLLLPVLGRTDVDLQQGVVQSVTVEDSMSMVHSSRGFLTPPGDQVRSEPWIIAGIAEAVLGKLHGIDWSGMVSHYDRIREKIEVVFPDFHDFNVRVRVKGGFRLSIPPAQRIWPTKSGRANFLTARSLDDDLAVLKSDKLVLTTIRSHDQYNTTIYSLNDRYRGIFGRRDVVFMNSEDLRFRGLCEGDLIDVLGTEIDGKQRVVRRFTAVEYDIPRGVIAGYYPEFNPVVSLDQHDLKSGTPSYKGIPVRVMPSIGT